MLIVGALPLANVTATALPPQQAQALAVILTILSLGIPHKSFFPPPRGLCIPWETPAPSFS